MQQPPGMVTKFAKNGVPLSLEERKEIARRKGLCAGCGLKTHTISVFKRAPITNDNVYKGVCIQCCPSQVPAAVLAEYEKYNPRIHAPLSLTDRRTRRQQQQQQQQHSRELEVHQSTASPKPAFPDRRRNPHNNPNNGLNQQQQSKMATATMRLNMMGPPLTPAHKEPASLAFSTRDDFGAVDAYLVVERRPVTLEVQNSMLPSANGIYELDPSIRGAHSNYTRPGFLEEDNQTPVTFLFHRSARRWFLSAVLGNGGRVYLYSAPVSTSKPSTPPNKGWAKMNGVAGTASIEVVVLTTEEARSQQNLAHNQSNHNHNHNPVPSAGQEHEYVVAAQEAESVMDDSSSGDYASLYVSNTQMTTISDLSGSAADTISNVHSSVTAEKVGNIHHTRTSNMAPNTDHSKSTQRAANTLEGVPQQTSDFSMAIDELHRSNNPVVAEQSIDLTQSAATQQISNANARLRNDPYGHGLRCSGLQEEAKVYTDLDLSATENILHEEQAAAAAEPKEVVWDAEDSAHLHDDDYQALPEANPNDLYFPWEQPKTAAASGSSLVAGRVTIQVKTPTLQEFYVIMNARPDTPVLELKREIQKRQGIPIPQQELCQKKDEWPTLLQNERTLQDYDLFNTSSTSDSNAPSVDLHFPPGYPCRRIMVECFGEKHKVDVEPCDTIERVITSIKTTTSWFVDQMRYMPPSEAERIGIQLILERRVLRDTSVTVAELNIPNQTVMQLETLVAIDADKIACAGVYQQDTLDAIIGSNHSSDQTAQQSSSVAAADELLAATIKRSLAESETAGQVSSSVAAVDDELAATIKRSLEDHEKEKEAQKVNAAIQRSLDREEEFQKLQQVDKKREKEKAKKRQQIKNRSPRASPIRSPKPKAAVMEGDSKADLLAKLAKCRAYQEEVMEKIVVPKSDKSDADAQSMAEDSDCKTEPKSNAAKEPVKEEKRNSTSTAKTCNGSTLGPDSQSQRSALGTWKEDTPPSQVEMKEASTHSSLHASFHSAPVKEASTHPSMHASFHSAVQPSAHSSFDPAKLVEEVEEMKQKVERMEREKHQQAEAGQAATPNTMQILPGQVAGTISISNGMPVMVVAAPPGGAVPTTASASDINPPSTGSNAPPAREMPKKKSEHSKRIDRLEAKLSDYENQLTALLKVMEITHAGGAEDTELAKRRVALAHKILRGEHDTVLERAVYGFQMDDGDSECFQPNRQ